MNIFNEQLDDEMLETLAKCHASTKYFASTFFPQRFYRPFTKLHDEIFDVLDDDSIKRAVIVAPRGIGKTTLLSEVYPLKRLLFRDSHYIVSLSANESSATEQTENMKSEIITNDKIISVFGDLSRGRMGKEEWILNFENGDASKVMPRGAGQAVRGRRFLHYRPDLILVDDLENDKNIKSEMQRQEKRDWFFSSLQNIVDVYGDGWRIIVVGTIMHEDSLLQTLIESSDWKDIVIPLADENLHSNIPEWKSDKWIKDELDRYDRQGEIDKFYMELMCTVIPGEKALFKKSYFRDYTEDEIRNDHNIITVILSDPARSTDPNSCDTAVMAVGVDTVKERLYIRDIELGKFSPVEHDEIMLNMADTYGASLLAPEATGLENRLIYPLKEAMLERYSTFKYPICNNEKGVHPIKSKEDRGRALVPWYKRSAIFHNVTVKHLLEPSLLSFPKCKKWDTIDCLSNLIDVMDDNDMFLMESDEFEDPAVIEDEYAKLEREDQLAGTITDDWKCI